MMVCIDPGHGGKDPGAVAGGVREADVALDYALAVGAELERAGLAVLYTRTTDRTLDLAARAKAGDEHGATLFLSVHCNASASPDPHGFQVFHAAGSVAGGALARAIYDRVIEVVGTSRWSGVHPDESPACGNRRLYVLRATRMPAVLVELGFLTHAGDRERLTDPERRARIARAIAEGVTGWLGA